MNVRPPITVEDYLRTSYPDGDREYVEGRIVERNVGEVDHSDVQSAVLAYLRSKVGKQFWAGVEARVQIHKDRFRVPDVVVVEGGKPLEPVITSPPLLVIEVLSKDDRADEVEEKINDYLSFGVTAVWVLNPRTRRAFIHTSEGSREVKDGILRSERGGITVPLAEVFE